MEYSKEQVAEVVAAYQEVDSQEDRDAVVAAYAEKFDTTVASVRGKLVAEKVYVAKVKGDRKGSTAMDKSELVGAIRIFLGARANTLESLTKATKADLKVILDQLKVINNRSEVA